MHADIVVIGGGVHGASLAFHLARRGAGDVVLIEKGQMASGPTAQSGAMIRPLFAVPVYIHLVLEATRTFEHWADEVGGDAGFVQNGFLRVTRSLDPHELGGDLELLRDLSVPFEVLPSHAVRHHAPEAAFDEQDRAVFLPRGGYADPILTTESLSRAARRLGATILTNTFVRNVRVANGKIEAVETDRDRIQTRVVVNCAGAWGMRLAATAGVELPIRVHRQPTCLFKSPGVFATGRPCFSDGVNRVFYRETGGDLVRAGVFGWVNDPAEPDNFDKRVALPQLDQIKRSLDIRIHKQRRATFYGGFSALYDMTPDGHPIVSPLPQAEGLWCNCGWSGNGFASAPAVGRCLAQMITEGHSDIDLSMFAWPRPEGTAEMIY